MKEGRNKRRYIGLNLFQVLNEEFHFKHSIGLFSRESNYNLGSTHHQNLPCFLLHVFLFLLLVMVGYMV